MWSLRYRKRHSKKELTFFQFLSRLFQLAYKIMQANSGVEFITTISKFRKRKFLHRLVTSSLKHKIRHFQVVVEKERQKMYKKAWCCFANSTYRLFDIFVLVAIVAMCVLSLSCFLGLPILGFRHVTRRSCSSTKQYNSPPPQHHHPRLICIKRATLPEETTAESVLVTQRGRMKDSEL